MSTQSIHIQSYSTQFTFGTKEFSTHLPFDKRSFVLWTVMKYSIALALCVTARMSPLLNWICCGGESLEPCKCRHNSVPDGDPSLSPRCPSTNCFRFPACHSASRRPQMGSVLSHSLSDDRTPLRLKPDLVGRWWYDSTGHRKTLGLPHNLGEK